MSNLLIEKLKLLAKKKLENNKRFHDYAHAICVFQNAKSIIKGEKAEGKIKKLAILTAALFHDISNKDKHDSLDSAKKVSKLLKKVKDFPSELIKEVERLIISIEKGRMNEKNLDELIINEADSLEALSKLSLCRGFMICARRKYKLKQAIENINELADRKFNEIHKNFHTKTAKQMADKRIKFIKKFLKDCLRLYNK